MSNKVYDIGDRPRIYNTFHDDSDPPELIDPTAIIFTLRKPDGTFLPAEAIGDATKISLGLWTWTIPIPFDSSGTWWVRTAATSPIQTAEELALPVQKSKF